MNLNKSPQLVGIFILDKRIFYLKFCSRWV